MTLNVKHDKNVTNVEKVTELYSQEDGVDIKYVCTTDIPKFNVYVADIFYRDTPHPTFNNKYFGLTYNHLDQLVIFNADTVENLNFSMFEDDKGFYHYSSYRHHFNKVDGKFVDGGRSYTRTNTSVKVFHVKNGVFVG